MADNPNEKGRKALVGLAVLVAVAVALGGLVSTAVLSAAKVIGSVPEEEVTAPAVSTPDLTRSTSSTPSPAVAGSQEPAPSMSAPTERAGDRPTTRRPDRDRRAEDRRDRRRRVVRAQRPRIVLTASRSRVGRYERVRLHGSYRGANGTRLLVQRFEGRRWVAFPATATVRGGRFTTYVQAGRPGKNQFRVVDRSTGGGSAPVTVAIG